MSILGNNELLSKHLLELLELTQPDEVLVKEYLKDSTITQLFQSYSSITGISLSGKNKIEAIKIIVENYR
jgi:hypothetical protein